MKTVKNSRFKHPCFEMKIERMKMFNEHVEMPNEAGLLAWRI
jgi:hypothetical protein